jgi:hypothetical protein
MMVKMETGEQMGRTNVEDATSSDWNIIWGICGQDARRVLTPHTRDAERRVEYLWADYSGLDVSLRSPVTAATTCQPPRVVETDCIFDISDDEGALDASEDEYSVWCQQPRNPLVNQPVYYTCYVRWTREDVWQLFSND